MDADCASSTTESNEQEHPIMPPGMRPVVAAVRQQGAAVERNPPWRRRRENLKHIRAAFRNRGAARRADAAYECTRSRTALESGQRVVAVPVSIRRPVVVV